MTYYPEGANSALYKKLDTVEDVKRAMHSGEVLEGRVVMCDKGHNLHIDLGAMRGIIPRNEGAFGILEGSVRDIALISKVNKLVCFRIVGFHKDDFGETLAVLSRRSVQLDCMNDYLDNLVTGDVINARVTHLERFGAFIDIGAGINSLIPIDMLSVSRISHPRERLCEGQSIRCVLKSREDNKLTFSLKELLGTWEQNASRFSVGETVTGIVRSIESYGIFVELMPNLAGLAEGFDGAEVGQRVSVFIKSILPDRMKVKLVIVDTFEKIDIADDLEYFVDDNHIYSWEYSPNGAIKTILSTF